MNQAKSLWLADLSQNGAEKAGAILSTINPMASCQNDIASFIKTIDTKLKADEKASLEFKMKQYKDSIELEKARINSYREIANEYARNQPSSVIYNNIYWR